MPRKPRIVVPGQPLHVLQRGNNRQAIFFTKQAEQALNRRIDACAHGGDRRSERFRAARMTGRNNKQVTGK